MQKEKSVRAKVISLPCDDELLSQVEDFRYENRIPTAADTLRRLISDGLAFNKQREAQPA